MICIGSVILDHSFSLRRLKPDVLRANKPKPIIINAAKTKRILLRELFPVCGRSTSSLDESVPTPVSGSIVYVSNSFPDSSDNAIMYVPSALTVSLALEAVTPVLL